MSVHKSTGMDHVVAFCASVWREMQEDGLEAFLFPRAAYRAVPLCEANTTELQTHVNAHRCAEDAMDDDGFRLPEDYAEIRIEWKRQHYGDPVSRFDADDVTTVSLLSAPRA
ncbi:hypothetical protein SPRG_10328 [Saprolegnia parasitica CBS 223.65]|uniref:Uncharacterized protein n=1 Tax=Saprolegnia parasitica (strain CBS 223.65) TaxID=695850 RepID=A0A067C1V0_SAPPC|nr:hypothetical protein SPRG_10328 [Saprolegnia parasitica CBS 223.65]KDO24513.1 hypothetical protein SPRG_10328 [Saprolegnia parasitica CBS 223.65]|eukprot:XP_012204775.1 hypothetical protein SPRG_10328 [Saprolegnia parasitica CBS 223.65]